MSVVLVICGGVVVDCVDVKLCVIDGIVVVSNAVDFSFVVAVVHFCFVLVLVTCVFFRYVFVVVVDISVFCCC